MQLANLLDIALACRCMRANLAANQDMVLSCMSWGVQTGVNKASSIPQDCPDNDNLNDCPHCDNQNHSIIRKANQKKSENIQVKTNGASVKGNDNHSM